MTGGILRAVAGAPKVSTVSSVKNPALAGNINSLISGYQDVAKSGDTALSDYISKYMAGSGAATKRTGEEIGSIDQFYNGSMANQLAQLRANRSSAMTDAANVASKQAIGAQNRSRVMGSGGTGSYDTRLSMANLTPIRTAAALDSANQERADLGYMTQNQIGLAGARTNLATQNAGYGLVPEQTRLSMLQGRAGYLKDLGNLDQQNTFYGLQQKPNVMADVADSVAGGVLNAAAAYSSMGGGMGGMGKAGGGLIRGPGTETSDSIPARLSSGEFVVPAEAVDMPGVLPMLEGLRRAGLARRTAHHFARGGMVTAMPMEPAVHPFGYNYETRGEPGLARRRWRYADGGVVDIDSTVEPWHYRGGGLVRVGYADGGLAASAQQYVARSTADLTPQWEGATIIGGDNGAMPMGGAGSVSPLRRRLASPMPMMPPGADVSPNEYFRPGNYDTLAPKWQQWGNATARYYNDPSSPGYIPPGTYE